MGLYNFQPRFVPFILDHSKTHTIRSDRVHRDNAGNIMHLFTGLRHPGARCLMRCPCVKVERIEITEMPHILIDGNMLTEDECNQLAWRDGFRPADKDDAFITMMEFWSGRLPFFGHIYHWNPEIQLRPLRHSKGYGRQNP